MRLQDPSNPRARIYKHYKYGHETSKDKQKIGTKTSCKADVGDGEAGLAARQLLSESILSAGASFEDSHASSKGKGKGKRKGEGKTKQARMTSCISNTKQVCLCRTVVFRGQLASSGV